MKTKRKQVRHLPDTWCKMSNTIILDPDGWRDGTSWKKPLTKEEFEYRRNLSTIVFRI